LSPGVLELESGCTTEPIEEGSMIFVGDDSAENHHDVHVMDEAGLRLSSRRLPKGVPRGPPSGAAWGCILRGG
jgi:hypothetical protein